jgi:uncharacterized iron-regulated protein
MYGIYLVCIGLVFALGSCSHLPTRSQAQPAPTPLTHFYDYQLVSSATQQPISVEQLVHELASSDVIFVGEWHSHSASHYLQMQLLAALYPQHPQLILSMEQFARDKQAVLNQYLAGEIGEQTLLDQGEAWPNYASDYRPLVEFAKAHHLTVIAANAPTALVRCIAQKGPAVADKLPSEQRAYLAQDLTQSSAAYQEKFRQFLMQSDVPHGPSKKTPEGQIGGLSNSFYAQLARDNTMAESIARALDAQPHHQVMAINGAFHSDGQLGTVDALKRLKPNLNIRVISPYAQTADAIDLATATQQGDYIYIVQALPKRYVQKQHRDRAVRAMMERQKAHQCPW